MMNRFLEKIVRKFGKCTGGGSAGGTRECETANYYSDYKFLGREYRFFTEVKQNLNQLRKFLKGTGLTARFEEKNTIGYARKQAAKSIEEVLEKLKKMGWIVRLTHLPFEIKLRRQLKKLKKPLVTFKQIKSLRKYLKKVVGF